MSMRMLLFMFVALALAACSGAPAVEPPLYPGAVAITAGESPLADAMVSGMAADIIGERNAAAIRLTRLPANTSWSQFKQFYADQFEQAGWRADPGLLVENDTIRYAAWRNGDQLLVIAAAEDAFAGASYAAVALVRP